MKDLYQNYEVCFYTISDRRNLKMQKTKFISDHFLNMNCIL